MAGPGDSRINNPPAPTQAQEIVSDLFGGNEQKKLDSAQQASNLREQSQQQDTLMRSTTREQAREAEGQQAPEDRGPREGNRVLQQRQQAAALAAEEGLHETAMDKFLTRASQQQQSREAGREMMRAPTLASVTAQGWSVANSSQTPEGARKYILAQQTGQNFANTPNPGTNPQATPRLPFSPAMRDTLPMPMIHYATPNPSSGEAMGTAYAPRGSAPDFLNRMLNQMVQSRLGAMAQQSLMQGPTVAVHLRGPLVFVRDGKEFRAFQRMEDGSLRELPTEDGQGHPLSPEAQNLLQKVLRQRALHSGADGQTGGAGEAGELSGEQLAELERITNGGATKESGEGLDFETRFALLLHQVLDENKKLGKEWKEGELYFPEKGDWAAFFANLLKVGGQEKEMKKALDDILSMIFRGLYEKKGKGNTLVGDFKFMGGDKVREEKFAQITLQDPSLLELLAQLKPGQTINLDLLRKIFGDELSFLQLKHLTEPLFQVAEGADKNLVFDTKARINPFTQARLERSIFWDRKSKAGALPKLMDEDSAALASPLVGSNGFSAHVWEWIKGYERHSGPPRLFTVILYLTLTLLFLGASLWALIHFL